MSVHLCGSSVFKIISCQSDSSNDSRNAMQVEAAKERMEIGEHEEVNDKYSSKKKKSRSNRN